MSWTPKPSPSERIRDTLVPAALRIRYLYRRETTRGEPEIGLIPFLADRNRVSLDIGANKGVYAYALLPVSRAVHAFEPNPKPRAFLEKWAQGKLHLHDIALSDKNGDAALLVPKGEKGYSNQGASLSSHKVSGPHRSVAVSARRLDDLNITDVGFMKIDVEGFEAQVLAGARQTIARDKPNILVEIEEKHTGRPLEEAVGEICRSGYHCYVLLRGTLRAFHSMDIEKHHRNPAARGDYLFNFIFLPKQPA